MNAQTIVSKVGSFCNTLRDDGVFKAGTYERLLPTWHNEIVSNTRKLAYNGNYGRINP